MINSNWATHTRQETTDQNSVSGARPIWFTGDRPRDGTGGGRCGSCWCCELSGPNGGLLARRMAPQVIPIDSIGACGGTAGRSSVAAMLGLAQREP